MSCLSGIAWLAPPARRLRRSRCALCSASACGLDLGTTTSAVAIIVDGRPVIVPNTDGGRTTPSVVAYLSSGAHAAAATARCAVAAVGSCAQSLRRGADRPCRGGARAEGPPVHVLLRQALHRASQHSRAPRRSHSPTGLAGAAAEGRGCGCCARTVRGCVSAVLRLGPRASDCRTQLPQGRTAPPRSSAPRSAAACCAQRSSPPRCCARCWPPPQARWARQWCARWSPCPPTSTRRSGACARAAAAPAP